MHNSVFSQFAHPAVSNSDSLVTDWCYLWRMHIFFSSLILLSTLFQINSYFEHMLCWLLDISHIWFLIAWNLTYKVSGLKPSCRNFTFNFMEVLYGHMIFVEAHLHFNHSALVLWTSILIWSQNIVEALLDPNHTILVLWTTFSMISLSWMKLWLQAMRTMSDIFGPWYQLYSYSSDDLTKNQLFDTSLLSSKPSI